MLFVGLSFELAGLLVTAYGLLQTWRANTRRPFLPRPFHRASWWMRRHLLRRPVRKAQGGVAGSFTLGGHVTGHAPLLRPGDDETIEQRLDRIEANIDQVDARTLRTQEAIADNERKRDRQVDGIARSIVAARRELTDLTKQTAIDGIRTAVLGLLLLAVGAVVQGIAAVL